MFYIQYEEVEISGVTRLYIIFLEKTRVKVKKGVII